MVSKPQCLLGVAEHGQGLREAADQQRRLEVAGQGLFPGKVGSPRVRWTADVTGPGRAVPPPQRCEPPGIPVPSRRDCGLALDRLHRDRTSVRTADRGRGPTRLGGTERPTGGDRADHADGRDRGR